MIPPRNSLVLSEKEMLQVGKDLDLAAEKGWI